MSRVRECNVKSCDRVRGVGLDQHYHISYSYNFVTSSWTLNLPRLCHPKQKRICQSKEIRAFAKQVLVVTGNMTKKPLKRDRFHF